MNLKDDETCDKRIHNYSEDAKINTNTLVMIMILSIDVTGQCFMCVCLCVCLTVLERVIIHHLLLQNNKFDLPPLNSDPFDEGWRKGHNHTQL